MKHLDRDLMRRLARVLAVGVVVEPAAIYDAHTPLADGIADDDGTPADVELAAAFHAGLELGLLAERYATLRTEAGAVLDDAPAARTDGHVAYDSGFLSRRSWARQSTNLTKHPDRP